MSTRPDPVPISTIEKEGSRSLFLVGVGEEDKSEAIMSDSMDVKTGISSMGPVPNRIRTHRS